MAVARFSTLMAKKNQQYALKAIISTAGLQAVSIHKKTALESTSWGLGQVMGAHWEWLGYSSIDELVAEARNSVGGQVRLMLKFIDKAGLKTALEQKHWRNFARRYNGPAFARNQYDSRMAAAFERWNRSLGRILQAV